MILRSLDPQADRAAVANLYARAADYVMLETGEPPDEATVTEFFEDAPPQSDEPPLKLGLWGPVDLAGIADLGFGYPGPGDAYLGLMLLDPSKRGSGIGSAFLAELMEIAREHSAPRLFVAVFAANPRGRAFWTRQGFRPVLTFPPRKLRQREHVLTRMMRPL